MADNQKTIQEKYSQLTQLMGSSGLNANQQLERLKSIAQVDPAKYNQVIQLATDIDNYYRSQHNTVYNWRQRNVNQAFDVGEANSDWNYAANILYWTREGTAGNRVTNFLNLTRGIDSLGNKVERQADSLYKKAGKSVVNETQANGEDLFRQMKQVYDGYIYMVKALDSLPDDQAHEALINKFSRYAADYVNTWNALVDVLNKNVKPSNEQLKAFLDAYIANPFNPPIDDMNTLKYLRDKIEAGSTVEQALGMFKDMPKNWADRRKQ